MSVFGYQGRQFGPDSLYNLRERIAKLEEKVFKKVKRKQGTKSQKLLLLKELGLLENIDELSLPVNKRALLVSILIDEDPESVEKDLRYIHKSDSDLKIEVNYAFLVELYENLGLEKLAANAERTLNKIISRKEEKKK